MPWTACSIGPPTASSCRRRKPPSQCELPSWFVLSEGRTTPSIIVAESGSTPNDSRRPMDVDRVLDLGEDPADRRFRALAVGNRLLEHAPFLIAGDGDQDGSRGKDCCSR